MKNNYLVELSHILWNLYDNMEYTCDRGRPVRVLQRGQYDPERERFTGGKVDIDGQVYHGDIVIRAGREMPRGDFENTVLHVTPVESAAILRADGEQIPRIIVGCDPVCAAAYENLKAGSTVAGCSGYIAAMESHERVALFTRLMADRLYRKYREVMRVFDRCEQNWNETLYTMLLRAMGKPLNSEVFGELAHRVKYKTLCKERGAVQNAEALLLGASGLLETYEEDQYVRQLKSTFIHLAKKHSIEPLRAGQWVPGRNNGNGIPVLRLAQLAAFFTEKDLMVDHVVRCNTVEDIHRFFDIEASVYWSSHYKPGEKSITRKKKVGGEKANTLGINFIVPMKFAYGVYMADEALKEEALALLEKIVCEDNRIVNAWRRGGTLTENAFDSQAVLQLDTEYCRPARCWVCPVGKRVIKSVFGERPAQKV